MIGVVSTSFGGEKKALVFENKNISIKGRELDLVLIYVCQTCTGFSNFF